MHRTQRTPLKLRKLIGLLPFWLLQSSTYYKHYMQQVLWVNLDRQFITSKERWSIKNLIQWLKWYFGHITPFILYWTCKGVELQFISHKKKNCRCRCQFQSKHISDDMTWIAERSIYLLNILGIGDALALLSDHVFEHSNIATVTHMNKNRFASVFGIFPEISINCWQE